MKNYMVNKKAADIYIFTLQGNYNFGNRLQNIALQYYLQKLGKNVVTYQSNSILEKIKTACKSIYAVMYDHLGLAIKKNSTLLLREYRFRQYCKKYIRNGKTKDFRKSICMVGSDQVWAPEAVRRDPNMLLENVICAKKVSYAASIGQNSIPEKLMYYYQLFLADFDYISVREENGTELLQKMGCNNVCTVVDPTLLLDSKEWEGFEEKVREIENVDYVIICFLSPPSQKRLKGIKKYAVNKKWVLIDIMNSQSKKWYCINPGEFLYLIHHAKCVFTDSYHVLVFSWIFQTTFFVYSRNSKIDMSSRITYFLKLIQSEDRLDVECADENIKILWKNKIPIKDRISFSKNFLEANV